MNRVQQVGELKILHPALMDTDDDKSAIKKHIQEDTKQQIISNEKVIKQANKELKDHLHTLADSFGVDITIIDAK